MLNIAIIGLGTVSSIHKNAIENNELASIVAVCDIDESKKSDYPNTNFYTDIDDMLDNEKIDCVHICLPHYLHLSAIIKCASKGVNVFSEKPLTLTYEDATQLFGLESKFNVKIGVCLQNRYNSTSVKIKSIVQSKEYGEFLGSKGIVTWKRTMDYYNEASWRGTLSQAGGGVMMNQSIHTLDLLSFIGGEFDTVFSKISNLTLPQVEIEDTVVAHFNYKDSDATSVYFATIGYCSNSAIEIEMVFEKAIFKIFNNKLYRQDIDTMEYTLLCEDEKLSGTKHYYGAGHVLAINHFYNAIEKDTDDYIHVEEAAYSVKLIEKIVESSRDNSKKKI